MQLVDVAHSLPHTALTELDQLRANYGWSDRNHRIFTRMFGLKSAAMHPDLPLRRHLQQRGSKGKDLPALGARALREENDPLPPIQDALDLTEHPRQIAAILAVDEKGLDGSAEKSEASTLSAMSRGNCLGISLRAELSHRQSMTSSMALESTVSLSDIYRSIRDRRRNSANSWRKSSP